MYPQMRGGQTRGGLTLDELVQTCEAYQREFRQRIVRDASEARSVAALEPKVENIFSNTGDCDLLVVLDGTVPIMYQGKQYNIPMEIRISKNYPQSAPMLYVMPKAGMRIVDSHNYVSRDGEVSMPYLSEWQSSRSSLVGAIKNCQRIFGENPPVMSHAAQPAAAGYPGAYPASPPPPPAAQRSQPAPPPPAYASFAGPGYPRAAPSQGGSWSGQPPQPAPYPRGSSGTPPPPPYPVSGLPSRPRTPQMSASHSSMGSAVRAASNEERSRLGAQQQSAQNTTRQALELKLQKKFEAFRERMKKEMSEEFQLQSQLEESHRALGEGLHKLEEQKSDLEATIEELDMKETQLKTWLAEYGTTDEDHSSSAIAQINLDEAIVPADGLSRQLFDCVAETSAIDDTLYHLDRALSNDIIKLPDFLKEVRKLARKQFMAKALAFKIQEHQQKMHMQTRQVPHLNSRPPPYRPS